MISKQWLIQIDKAGMQKGFVSQVGQAAVDERRILGTNAIVLM